MPCYHYNAHNYNITSSFILFWFKFDRCLFGHIFQWGLVSCRSQSIDLWFESLDWFMYDTGFYWGCFRTDFSCLMFCHYLFYHWFKCFLFCLSMVIENVLWHARVGIFNAYKFQSIKIKHEESSAISEDIPVFH